MATNTKLTKLLKGRQVDSIRQRDAELDIDFTDGSTLAFSVELEGGNAAGHIVVTDEDDDEEYAA